MSTKSGGLGQDDHGQLLVDIIAHADPLGLSQEPRSLQASQRFQDPQNPHGDTVYDGPGPAASSRKEDCHSALPDADLVAEVKHLAKEMLKYCPGCGQQRYTWRFRHPLMKIVDKPDSTVTLEDLRGMTTYMVWRNDQLSWTDNIVDFLSLPKPDNQRIRSWSHVGSCFHEKLRDPTLEERISMAQAKILASNIFDDPPPGLGPKWRITTYYLSLALGLACKAEWDMDELILQIVECKLTPDIVVKTSHLFHLDRKGLLESATSTTSDGNGAI